jgi:putative flavoprotein involved in K+ transport
MREHHDTVVIGGGQAGLAMSYHLQNSGREHIILERNRIAERWRSERWDSLAFQFPNASLELPGWRYQGNDPNGFASCEAVTQFIEDYAQAINAPIRCGVKALSLEAGNSPDRFTIRTEGDSIEARHIVIATGPFQRPAIPAAAMQLPGTVFQVHANDYRNPDQLPPGAILVVDAGGSGCQVAEELHGAGREVYLSVRSHGLAPRRYRGRDLFWWLFALGKFDATIESQPNHRIPSPLLLTGANGGHDINLRQFAAAGMHLLGSFLGVEDGILNFAADLEMNLTKADHTLEEFKRLADAYLSSIGENMGDENVVEQPCFVGQPHAPVPQKLSGSQIGAVIWCTGYQGDFGWVRVPVFDAHGNPAQRRGVTTYSGVYFLGLHWMHKMKSGTLFGVGEDAAYLAEQIVVA